jgi:hypothetical protein
LCNLSTLRLKSWASHLRPAYPWYVHTIHCRGLSSWEMETDRVSYDSPYGRDVRNNYYVRVSRRRAAPIQLLTCDVERPVKASHISPASEPKARPVSADLRHDKTLPAIVENKRDEPSAPCASSSAYPGSGGERTARAGNDEALFCLA